MTSIAKIERRRALEKLRGATRKKTAGGSSGKRKPTERMSDRQRALLTMLEEPEGGSLYVGSKKEKRILSELVARKWARIAKTEPKGPEGPQHWATITPAGARALQAARMRLMDATLAVADSLTPAQREALDLAVEASNEGGATVFDMPAERAAVRKLEQLRMVTVIDKLPAVVGTGERREQWVVQATRYGGNVNAYLKARG